MTNEEKEKIRIEFYKELGQSGNFPLSYLTGKDSDSDTYQQQMHVISFVASKRKVKRNRRST